MTSPSKIFVLATSALLLTGCATPNPSSAKEDSQQIWMATLKGFSGEVLYTGDQDGFSYFLIGNHWKRYYKKPAHHTKNASAVFSRIWTPLPSDCGRSGRVVIRQQRRFASWGAARKAPLSASRPNLPPSMSSPPVDAMATDPAKARLLRRALQDASRLCSPQKDLVTDWLIAASATSPTESHSEYPPDAAPPGPVAPPRCPETSPSRLA